MRFFYRNDLWVIIKKETWLSILDLSLNSYLGILFIIIGLIIKIDFKLSTQKDL